VSGDFYIRPSWHVRTALPRQFQPFTLPNIPIRQSFLPKAVVLDITDTELELIQY
jgi:hypothetical protein